LLILSTTVSRKLASCTFMVDMPRWFVGAKHLREYRAMPHRSREQLPIEFQG
jgi:hypothetical protein